MNNVKVSIIVPIYNSEKYIDSCLKSLLNQTLKEIEIICVNDGSTDNSWNILSQYAETYGNIRIFNQENSGAAVTRNKGIDEAKGEYITFVDADDWIENFTIEKVYNNALNNQSDIVLFNSCEFNDNGKIRDRIYFYPEKSINIDNYVFDFHSRKKLVFNMFLVCWSKLYKTSFLRENNIKFHVFPVLEDIQFHVESMILAKRISYVFDVLYHYRKDNINSVQNSKVKTKDGFVIYTIFSEIREFLLKHNAYSFLELNYLKMVLNDSKVRLEEISDEYKEEMFQLGKDFCTKLHINQETMKKLDFRLMSYYIHVLVSETYFEFMRLEHVNSIDENYFDNILLDQLYEKNKVLINKNLEIDNLNYYKGILDNISKSFDDDALFNKEDIDQINNLGYFDENFYRNQYGYDLDINPLLHYIYQGSYEGKNPSAKFDGNFYENYHKEVKESGLNPLIYFITKGVKEGNIKITKTSWQPGHINPYELDQKIDNFNSLGISEKKRNPQLIVSLTSFPDRMKDIHYCLYSLLNQKLKPDKVILWLASNQFPHGEHDIPLEVLKLKKNGLTIKFCDDLKSYKKLLPALKEYPDDIIVTSDDDLYYPDDWLEKLYNDYLKNPTCVICHRPRRIKFDSNYNLKEYMDWNIIEGECSPTYFALMTGAGGVLYPPHALHPNVFNLEVIKNNYATTDDIWFWAMAVLNKTKIKTFDGNYDLFDFVNPARDLNLVNEKTLFTSNENTGNYVNMNKILKQYPEILDLMKNEGFKGK